MKNKLFHRLICIIAAVCLIVPMFAVQVSAVTADFSTIVEIEVDPQSQMQSPDQCIDVAINIGTNPGAMLPPDYVIDVINTYAGNQDISIDFRALPLIINWSAIAENSDVILYNDNDPIDGTAVFNMTDGTIASLLIDESVTPININIGGNAVILGDLTFGADHNVTLSGNADVRGTISGAFTDNRIVETAPSAPAPSAPPPSPEIGEIKSGDIPVLGNGYIAPPTYTDPTVEITDDTPFEQNGKSYAGTVDIVSVDSDTPQEIPSEVFIDGKRYLVGDTVYIVGSDEKKIETTADTGFSYVFTAVENSDKPVKFTAEGLPEGLEMSADGVITTKTLPAPIGTFKIKVTADNGADTNVYELTIEIKSEMTDAELLKKLTENDIPELLTEPQEDIHRMWINEELSIHYEPDIDDFYAVFLDGQLLGKTAYRVEEGSTVIILTEQTIAPLPNGDHVVTTMFHQESNVGLDTVINDVGSSCYVFRFGDEKSDNKRINISGDGVEGSVTFNDKDSKESPITTISANTEAIEQRAKNLSNATGCEIIAAFETKQHGGFGGKTATFAVSLESLNLKLKDKTTVYIAVYDSKTGKTYQNKGTVKDGMIVFKTKHSGVFMISKEKY
jgi:hypothetical protein